MFRIVPQPTFTADVRLSVPGSDTPQVLSVTWRHSTVEELDAWRASAATHSSDAAFLAQKLVGWSGVLDGEDRPVPFSTDNLARLLNAYPAAAAELTQAYIRQLADARAKN